jgi:transcriptional regulator with XRE-family HTH domain
VAHDDAVVASPCHRRDNPGRRSIMAGQAVESDAVFDAAHGVQVLHIPGSARAAHATVERLAASQGGVVMSPTGHGEVVAALLHHHPEPGTVIRIARTAAGWSQADLGKRCGYSASQISRWETGRQPPRDVTLLRRLAEVLHLPPHAFGLTDTDTAVSNRPAPSSGHRVGRVTIPMAHPMREEDDTVRRRTFLLAAGTVAGSVIAGTAVTSPATATQPGGDLDPARLLAQQLGDVLLGPGNTAGPATVGLLRQALATARQDFATCEYVPLAEHLPALLATAEATAADHSDTVAHQVLAESYNLATKALIKLEASGLEWLSADRGLLAARAAGEPLTLAEAQRLVASVARRAGHHDRAQTLTLAAASHLHISGAAAVPEHLAMYGMLHCSAGYAAARAGDRDRANDLLAEAAATTARLSEDPQRQQALAANVVSHRVSAAYVLGDAGAALAHARSLPLAAIPTTERRARMLVDIAQAWARFDKPDRAYATLLAAERTAPGEVRTRNAVRRLVGDLMASPKQAAMPGLPALAHRVHAA